MTASTENPLITAQAVEGEYYFPAFRTVVVDDGARLEVVCAGRERCFAGYRIERTDFPFLALEFVASGEGELDLAGTHFPLGPGSVFIYGPEVAHAIAARGDGLVKYFVDFAGPTVGQILRESGLAPGRHRVIPARRWLTDLFDQLVGCAELPRGEATWYAGRLLELLLRRAGDESYGDPIQPGSAHETFERCRRYLRSHAARLMSIDEAANECAVSAAYLVRLFKQFSRESAYAFLLRLKMDLAADRLLLAGSTVKSAGAAVGYEDPYHFSRVFKRLHGVSPKAYRERFHRRTLG